MSNSGILSQVMEIHKTNRKAATHFALCNGSQLRYLIDVNGGEKKLSGNLSTYSRKLCLLMHMINFVPLVFFEKTGLGYFVNARLHPEVEECRKNIQKPHWNVIIGTYDKKQKVVLQCFDRDGEAVFIKVGNASTEEEMNAEISFLRNKRKYTLFEVPELLNSKRRAEDAVFNIQVTKEFRGNKVQPILNQDIVRIYQELSGDKKGNLEFSHGDFAPWNLKKGNNKYTLFDWEHCGYRMKGFDLMHYATIIESLINGKDLSEAFDNGLINIRKYLPEFKIDKVAFLNEFKKLRKQIA